MSLAVTKRYIKKDRASSFAVAKTTRGSCTAHALRLLSIIIIIIIIKVAIYFDGDIFLSISQITRIADNTRRASESYAMKERLQETPIQYTQWRH